MHKTRMKRRNKRLKTDPRPEPETISTPVINHWERLSDEIFVSILRYLPQNDLVNISLINKKFRDVSRDSCLWKKLILDYNDIKQSANSCKQLIYRCNKLTSLQITNKSFNLRPLNLMSVVFRAKKSLKVLKFDSSIRKWSHAAFKKLGQMKELKGIKLAFATNSRYPLHEFLLLSNLDQLKEPSVHVSWRTSDSRTTGRAVTFLSKALYQFKKLRKVDLEITDSSNNQDTEELHLNFRRKRPRPWEVVNEDGDNLQQLMTQYPQMNV